MATTPQQSRLVKQSFAKLAPIAGEAADLFYGRLFEIAPQLRPLFKEDIKAQGAKTSLNHRPGGGKSPKNAGTLAGG